MSEVHEQRRVEGWWVRRWEEARGAREILGEFKIFVRVGEELKK